MRATVSKTFSFCAGHRLARHESKCRHLHGHNWRVTVFVSSPVLDECGRVVDFSAIKDRVKAWVNEHLDHGMILDRSDYTTVRLVEQLNGQKIYLMDGPPSAENIAALILRQAKALLESEFSKVKVERVTVGETDGSEATCTA